MRTDAYDPWPDVAPTRADRQRCSSGFGSHADVCVPAGLVGRCASPSKLLEFATGQYGWALREPVYTVSNDTSQRCAELAAGHVFQRF